MASTTGGLWSSADGGDRWQPVSVRLPMAVAVRFAAQMLYELFSKGRIAAHGVVVNLDSKRSGPIEVDPEGREVKAGWARCSKPNAPQTARWWP